MALIDVIALSGLPKSKTAISLTAVAWTHRNTTLISQIFL